MGQDGTPNRKPSTGGHRSPVGRGGLPYKKDGETHQNFGREPLGGTNSKTAYYLVSYFFQFSILTGTAADPNEHLLRLNALRGSKNLIFNS